MEFSEQRQVIFYISLIVKQSNNEVIPLRVLYSQVVISHSVML